MGCGEHLLQPEDEFLYAAPDFDTVVKEHKTQHHRSDFTCIFDSAFYSQIYFENVCITQLAFSKPVVSDDKDLYEDGIPFFKIIPYEYKFLELNEAAAIIQQNFTYLQQSQIQKLFNYVNLNKPVKQISSRDFIRLSYLCYRFHSIIDCPSLALFYYLDDFKSGFVAIKKLKQIIAQHYKIKKESVDFHTSQHYIDSVQYLKCIMKLGKQNIEDPMAAEISAYSQENVPDFDIELVKLTTEEEEFSDFSTGKAKSAQIRKLTRRAAALQWSDEELQEAIQHITKKGLLKNVDVLEGNEFM